MMDRDDWRQSGDWLGRIELLERQLEAYHEHLESSLQHDRQFQLKATWGIVSGLNGLGMLFAMIWLAKHLQMSDWVIGAIVGLGWIAAFALGAELSDRGRIRDEAKLSRLPVWQNRQ